MSSCLLLTSQLSGGGVARVRRCRYQAHIQRITGLFMRNKWRWMRGVCTRITDFDQERAVMPEAERLRLSSRAGSLQRGVVIGEAGHWAGRGLRLCCNQPPCHPPCRHVKRLLGDSVRRKIQRANCSANLHRHLRVLASCSSKATSYFAYPLSSVCCHQWL